MAEVSPPVRHLKIVVLKELLEGSVKAMMNRFESSIGTQSNICAVFARVRQDMFYYSVSPPPELRFAAPRGWNSHERKLEIRSVLTALEATSIMVEASPVHRDQNCDVYFRRVEEFIDRLFVLATCGVDVRAEEENLLIVTPNPREVESR
ncbi:hypothetical protein GN244_ATG10709 [Phytophthora infestans]|uniref:Uncharacterized protein n=1 Tax=Phytophthora infestans TaxID=4787 RepID=A0A833SSH1_PHYIN|nr:hypothetical protein GN244_ATG10709 [Phytophthora infestans]KAF4128483.1 hypothetical protein GN958_ATG22318 [Phytophthora infestans]KAI9983888.1 hypothetical protein PInf_005161 [Phytophthora infestans]